MSRWFPRKTTPEGRIKLQIIRYLRGAGHIVGKVNTMGVMRKGRYCYDPYNYRGFSDLVAFVNGKLYFIEVKSPDGKQTEEQKEFQGCVEKAGLTYILARSLEDVIKEVR